MDFYPILGPTRESQTLGLLPWFTTMAALFINIATSTKWKFLLSKHRRFEATVVVEKYKSIKDLPLRFNQWRRRHERHSNPVSFLNDGRHTLLMLQYVTSDHFKTQSNNYYYFFK